jgi:phosphotransferase family enzyme
LGHQFVESDVITDPGIPTLAKVFAPVVLGKCLGDVLPSAWGAIRGVRCQVLKYHLGTRCTFEIALRTTKGCHSLIGKVYATDRSDVHEAMDRIWKAGFGEGQEFSIPRPEGYLPELRLLLQEKVEGIRAKEIFQGGSDCDQAVAARQCARWLASFHAKAPKAGPVFHTNEHLARMEQWSRHITEAAPALTGKAARLFDRLHAAGSQLSSVEMCAGHGSYTAPHIVLAEGRPGDGGQRRTIVIDWDSYDVADPGYDVARFLVALQRRAFKYLDRIRALDAVAEVFLKTYFAECRPAAAANLPFYRAAVCLQLAKKDINRKNAGWSERAEATLDEGLRVLELGA